MNIAGSTLLQQLTRASKQWGVIAEANQIYGLPPYLLHAVGSRETNLTNEVGDGGHGHGIFQLDDRSHVIPPNFDNDITLQALTAAAMLSALFRKYGSWVSALNAYNSGQPLSQYTAGGDYGPDVWSRQQFLLMQLGVPVSDPVWDAPIVDHYQDNSNPGATLSARDLLSWAATHAAHANENSIGARNDLETLRQDLPGIVENALKNAVITVSIVTKGS